MPDRHIRFALACALLTPAAGQDASPDAERAARRHAVEAGLFAAVRVEGATWTIEQRMRRYRVPGLSVAVIRSGEIDWAAGYGVRDSLAPAPVTEHTLFQAGSISKPIAAIAAMDLVEDGLLSLEGDIRGTIESWSMSDDGVGSEHALTLEQLLSHTGGTTVHGFLGYAAGDPVPSLNQVLDGAPPANSARIYMDIAPGERTRYSGGGSTIVQRAMIDVTGEEFDRLVAARVLRPLGMRDSTYEQPLDVMRWPDHASAHGDGGRRHAGAFRTHPEQFAAGLWTTPGDLARALIRTRAALRGDAEHVLEPATIANMLEPRGDGSFGLGFQRDVREGELYFGHGGANLGFHARAFIHAESGTGAVVMTNADGGPYLMVEVLRSIEAAYAWPGIEHETATRYDDPADPIEAHAGRFQLGRTKTLLVSADGGQLEARIDVGVPVLLIRTAEREFVDLETGRSWSAAEDGSAWTIDSGSKPRRAERIDADRPWSAESLACVGRVDDAVAQLRAAHGSNPNDRQVSALVLARLAAQLDVAGDAEAAEAVSALSVSLHPDSQRAWETRAHVLERASDLAETMRAYGEVVRTGSLAEGKQAKAAERRSERARRWLAEHRKPRER